LLVSLRSFFDSNSFLIMIRTVAVSLAVVLLVGGTRAQEVETAKSGGGPEGYSQQYHYQSAPAGIGGSGGLSIDVSTGLLLALGAIIVVAALCSAFRGRDSGWGRSTNNQRSFKVANLSEKVLSGIEHIYETYNKMQ